MKISTLKYTQFEDTPQKWTLENATFEHINLIVGRNATGKTKILNVIKNHALTISRYQKLKFRDGNYEIHFENQGTSTCYSLKYGEKVVKYESLFLNDKNFLTRNEYGEGEIYSAQFERNMKFKVPRDQLALVAKRDALQHPFLEDLFNWADRLIHFSFGTSSGKETFLFLPEEPAAPQPDLKETEKTLEIFQAGLNKFPEKFVALIKKDMEFIGYELTDIKLGTPISIQFNGNVPSKPVGLTVKESDLSDTTDQNSMSQGMHRALTLIIQINFALLEGYPSCILIDDIGEGLDYDRASKLIKLLIRKAEQQQIQLIMSTNDRFVMNNVPLKYWVIVHRIGNRTICYNYQNSKAIFDDFELTGLNNFDFFSSNYYLKDKSND